MEITKDEIKYIFSYCREYLTADEHEAYKRLSWIGIFVKQQHSPGIETRRELIKKYENHYSEKSLELLNDGEEQFKINVAKRILSEHRTNPLFNYCPKCGKLARTPQAKQCRFCKHNWH